VAVVVVVVVVEQSTPITYFLGIVTNTMMKLRLRVIDRVTRTERRPHAMLDLINRLRGRLWAIGQ